MARIGGKSQSYLKELSTTDKTIVQLGNDNDSSILLGQLNCIPVASCTTSGGTAGKTATILNASLFKNSFAIQHSFLRSGSTVTEYLIGLLVKVQFTYKNTADAPTLNIGGTGALPITVNGVRMGAGVLGAGNYTFRLMPYGNSYSWECEDNGGRVSVTDGVVTNSNIDPTPLNSALTNLIADKNYTITLTGDGVSSTPPQTVYNTETLKIGDMYLCTFDILCGEITESKVAFLTLSSINTSSFRLVGEMYFYSTGNKVTINSLANKTGWLWNGADRLRTDYFSGKRIKGFLIAYPYSAPATQSLD